jgi:flagellar protein FlaJ
MISGVIKEFNEYYEQSGLSYSRENYLKGALLLAAGLLVTSFGITGAIHYTLLKMSVIQLLVPVLMLSMSIAILGFMGAFMFPVYIAMQRKKDLENGLIYTVSYMTVLATSGVSIENILERVAEVEDNNAIRQLAERFTVDLKFFGKDLSQALKSMSERSSSLLMSKFLDRIHNTVWSSGDLKSLMDYEGNRLITLKHEDMKKTLNSLTYLGEIYVAMLIVAPILFILMFSLLSVIGGGGSVAITLDIIVFFGIPIIAGAFLVILDTLIGADW